MTVRRMLDAGTRALIESRNPPRTWRGETDLGNDWYLGVAADEAGAWRLAERRNRQAQGRERVIRVEVASRAGTDLPVRESYEDLLRALNTAARSPLHGASAMDEIDDARRKVRAVLDRWGDGTHSDQQLRDVYAQALQVALEELADER